MEYKRGRKGGYHTKGHPMNTKERRKSSPLSKKTKFSNIHGMSFLGEKEESSKRAFMFMFIFLRVGEKFMTLVIPPFHA